MKPRQVFMTEYLKASSTVRPATIMKYVLYEMTNQLPAPVWLAITP
jgi:hypothetical protein